MPTLTVEGPAELVPGSTPNGRIIKITARQFSQGDSVGNVSPELLAAQRPGQAVYVRENDLTSDDINADVGGIGEYVLAGALNNPDKELSINVTGRHQDQTFPGDQLGPIVSIDRANITNAPRQEQREQPSRGSGMSR